MAKKPLVPPLDPSDAFAVTPVDRGGLVIKPCPFCGSAPEVCLNEHKGWIVFCDGESHLAQCGAFLTLQGAIDEWNRRQAKAACSKSGDNINQGVIP